jgi:hypothetical protein
MQWDENDLNRQQVAKMPAEATFQTKPEIALPLLEQAQA